jgi:hypothetical protein
MDKGKYVSRSEYQKVCEENKRLLRDIRILIEGKMSENSFNVRRKWMEHFRKDRELKHTIYAMVGSTVKTTDGIEIKMDDKVWVCDINEDCTKHIPVQTTAFEALNDNETYYYYNWQTCQDHCNEIDSIDIP